MPLEIRICDSGNIEAQSPWSNELWPSQGSPVNPVQLSQPLLSDIPLNNQLNLLRTRPLEQRRTLAKLNQAVGPDMLLALADFYDEQLATMPAALGNWMVSEHKGVLGASIGAMEHRLNRLEHQIFNYQVALEKVRAAYQAKLPRHQLRFLEENARAVHGQLKSEFADELTKRLSKVRARKANIWNNVDRGVHLAKSSRTSAPIQVASANELRQLTRFAGVANYAGYGMVAFDGYSRYTKVRNTYDSGSNWEKQAVQETVGISLGVIGSLFGVEAGYAAGFTIAIALMPVGWAILIGIGTGAAAGYFLGKKADELGKDMSGFVYDMSSRLY